MYNPKFTKMMEDLNKLVTQVRRDILRMVHGVNSGHPGGSLGCVEFFVTLYKRILNQSNLDLVQIEKKIINRKKEEKLNIFSDSHYLNLEKKTYIEIND